MKGRGQRVRSKMGVEFRAKPASLASSLPQPSHVKHHTLRVYLDHGQNHCQLDCCRRRACPVLISVNEASFGRMDTGDWHCVRP